MIFDGRPCSRTEPVVIMEVVDEKIEIKFWVETAEAVLG